jgi:hypothetical protein
MADDPSVYGSFMNFFLPQSARVGPASMTSSPGLFDMLGGMGFPGAAAANQPASAAEAQRKQQQQLMAMAPQGLKMLSPQQPQGAPPPSIPVSAAPQQQMPPPATQVTPSTPPAGGMAGLPSGYGGYPRGRPPMMPMPMPFGSGYGR